jgi:hypothetical protein
MEQDSPYSQLVHNGIAPITVDPGKHNRSFVNSQKRLFE